MKIYFGFTVAGDRSSIDIARIVQLLEEMGHEVLTRHLVTDNAWEADRQVSPQDVFRRDMAGWINVICSSPKSPARLSGLDLKPGTCWAE